MHELSVVLCVCVCVWGGGREEWDGYMSSLVSRRLHEFGRFISIACSSTRAQLHAFLCLAHLHASSLCISSVFSAGGATRKLIKQRLPTIGYFHAFHCLPIFRRQSIYGVTGFFLKKSRNFLIVGMQKLCFFVSVVAVDQLLLEKLRRS